MVRAAFNRHFEAWSNDGTYSPDSFLFDADGRLVPKTKSVFNSDPWDEATAYLTWNGSSLSAGDFTPIAGGYEIDSSTADIVIFPDDGTGWLVMRTEIILGNGTLPYRRAWLAQLF